MSADLEEVLVADASDVGPDQLAKLRGKIQQVVELDDKIAELEDRLLALKKERWAIVGHFSVAGELVGMFQSAGVKTLVIDARGNHPSYLAQLKNIFTAKLPEDERRAVALRKFRWLQGLSKTSYKVDFAKGQDKQSKKFASLLKKHKVKDVEIKVGVHASTLIAEIRRRFTDGEPLSPVDMDLLGAAVYPVVELTEQRGLEQNGKGQGKVKQRAI